MIETKTLSSNLHPLILFCVFFRDSNFPQEINLPAVKQKFAGCQRPPFVAGPSLTLEGDIGCGGLGCQGPPSDRLTTEDY